tara:strand:- start:84 stop:953 length:870 start_codon:yes stop_codon:yes gene_type:complete
MDNGGMRIRWEWVLFPPLLLSFGLLVASQFVFLRGGFFADLGIGRLGEHFTLRNYQRIFSDSFYLSSLWLTVKLSAITTATTLIIGFPVAYMLARMRSKASMYLMATIMAASFVTIVIKLLGLNIILSSNSQLNTLLMSIGLVSEPIVILGKIEGVTIGLMYFTLAFFVILLYGVVLSIPRSLEEASQVLGASRLRTYWRVVVPLALPGLVGSSLIVFNLCLGAFTSAALIGAGKVLTLPVLIQRTVLLDTKYGMGGALSVVLLVAGLLINLVSMYAVTRLKASRGMTA